LEVPHPDVPSLDLIDLPGLTAVPEEKRKEIEQILKAHLEEDKQTGNHDMYLTIIPASGDVRPSTNNAMRFVHDNNLVDRTIGVFSKCDQVQDFDILKSLITGEPTTDGDSAESIGAVSLKKGWTATMLKPPAGEYYETHQYERLWLQHGAETTFFNDNTDPILKELREKKLTGMSALVARIEQEYFNHLNTTWKNSAMRKVLEKLEEKEFEKSLLGVVPDEKQKSKMAAKEVERRLGPNSSMMELYSSFLDKVMEQKLRQGLATELGTHFGALGKNWASQDVAANLKKTAEMVRKFLATMETTVTNFFLAEIKNAITAEVHLEAAQQTNGLVSIGASNILGKFLALLPAMPKREAFKKIKEKALIQLSHYPQYTDAIMSKCQELFKQSLVEADADVEAIIKQLVAPNSPWLALTPTPKCASLSVACETDKFVNTLVTAYISKVPSPSVLKNVHVGLTVGTELQDALKKREQLLAEIGKIEAARDGIRRAFSIDDKAFAELQRSLDTSAGTSSTSS